MKKTKIFSALLCLVLALIMLVSCDTVTEVITPNNGDTQNTPGNDNTNQTVEQLPPGLYADINNTAIKIICPDIEEPYFNKYIPTLIKKIAADTGVTLPAGTDFEKGATTSKIENDNYEILIGNTNRLETSLVECPANSYVIKVVGKKVVIKGSSQYYTTMGLFYFINNCVGSKAESTLLKIDTSYTYTESPRNEASAYIDMIEKTSKNFPLFTASGGAETFVATGETFKGKVIALKAEKAFTFSAYTDSKGKNTISGMQGGCTDGTYLYFLLTNPGDKAAGTTDGDETRVIKMDPKTMAVVQVGPIISVAHSNDITYDSKYNRLVVAWCSVDAKKMSYIKMDTLDVYKESTFSEQFFAIDYDSSNNRFVFSGSGYAKNGYPIIIAKGGASAENYTVIRTFNGNSTGYVAQGIHCDSKYIYYTGSPNSSSAATKSLQEKINIVDVYDYKGKYVCTLTIDLKDEIEHIFWYDNSFWAGFNTSSGKHLYKLSF